MSKKSNKKSAKKKVSPKRSSRTKKPVTKKNASKAGARKASRSNPSAKKKAVKKAAPKKVKAKKVVKKVAKKPIAKKAVKKKAVKKAAPQKALARPIKKAAPQKVIAKKPVTVAKPIPAKKSPVEIAKPAAKVQVAKTVPETNHKADREEQKVVRIVKPMPKNEPIPTGKKSVLIDIKTGPEPAGKFELEYVVHASSQILFEFLTTPSGLSEWFCDDVNIRNGIYSFKWEENEQNARVVKLVEEKLVRFQWVDKHDNSYFEFRIERDDLTNDISLIITDFAETPEEKNSSTLLWNSQIDKLLHVLGAYF